MAVAHTRACELCVLIRQVTALSKEKFGRELSTSTVIEVNQEHDAALTAAWVCPPSGAGTIKTFAQGAFRTRPRRWLSKRALGNSGLRFHQTPQLWNPHSRSSHALSAPFDERFFRREFAF